MLHWRHLDSNCSLANIFLIHVLASRRDIKLGWRPEKRKCTASALSEDGGRSVPVNALVLTQSIHSETILQEHLVVWSAPGRSGLNCQTPRKRGWRR
jgi:hypothetical protein